MLRLLLFISFSLLLFYHVSGQNIKAAEYRYGLLSFEVQEGVEIDDETIKAMKADITKNVGSAVVAFQDSMIVSAILDSLTGVVLERDLYDLRRNQHYTFKNINDEPVFTLSEINPNELDRSGLPPLTYLSTEAVESRLPGLDLIEIKAMLGEDSSLKVTLEVATNIDFAPYATYSVSPFPIDSFVTAFNIPAKDISITIGVIEFQEGVPHPEWFNLSSEGYTDASLKNKVFESSGKGEPEERVRKGQGINLEIYKLLLENGYLSEDNMESDVIIKYNHNLDINGLLQILSIIRANGKSKYLVNRSSEEFISFFEEYGFSGSTLFSTVIKFKDLDAYLSIDAKWEALNWAALQDQLFERSTRKNYVDNLDNLGLLKMSDYPISEKFIEGEINFEDFLLKTGALYSVGNQTTMALTDFDTLANDFFKLLFARDFPDFKISRNENILIVRVNETDYAIDLEKHLKEDKVLSTYTKIIYTDTLNINAWLYNSMASIFDHVAFDNNMNFTYSVVTPEEFIKPFTYYNQTEVIMNNFPDLKLFKSEYYLKKQTIATFSSATSISLAFDQKYNYYSRGIKIDNFFEGGLVARLSFIPKATKEKFLDFVRTNQRSLLVSDSELKEIEFSVKTKPYKLPDPILDLLGNTTISFKEYPNSPYTPEFNNSTNTFADAYPKLNNLLRGKFAATDFSYDKEKYEVTFKYGAKTITSSAARSEMLEIAWNLLREKEAKMIKYYLYSLDSYGGDLKYYYLTPQEKEALEDILEVQFDPRF